MKLFILEGNKFSSFRKQYTIIWLIKWWFAFSVYSLTVLYTNSLTYTFVGQGHYEYLIQYLMVQTPVVCHFINFIDACKVFKNYNAEPDTLLNKK